MAGFVPGSTRARGNSEEQRVATFLEEQGLQVLARNVTIAGAELDLIARVIDRRAGEPGTLVFVEVRSRAHTRQGKAIETIGARKRSRIVRAATAWLVREGLWESVPVRFDVVGVTGREPAQVEWLKAAFQVDG